MCLVEEGLCLMGPDCSSWGIPSRGTSLRSFINALGNVNHGFVAAGNLTISRNLGCIVRLAPLLHMLERPADLLPRVTLICMLLCARHCYWVLEHPVHSLLLRHPRWDCFANKVCWVFWLQRRGSHVAHCSSTPNWNLSEVVVVVRCGG